MQLLPVHVPRAQFICELRHLINRPWGEVTDDEYVTCVGLPLLALIRVGLLPPEFDPNLSDVPPARRFAFLLHLLQQNSEEFKSAFEFNGLKVDDHKPGDFLLSCWADADSTRTVVHHVSIYTGHEPEPYGTHIQSLAREHGGAGRVYESPMSHLDWHRIESVYRLKALTDGEE